MGAVVDLAIVDRQEVIDYLVSKKRAWKFTDDPDIISAENMAGEVLITLNNARKSAGGTIIIWRWSLPSGWHWAFLPSVTHFLKNNE